MFLEKVLYAGEKLSNEFASKKIFISDDATGLYITSNITEEISLIPFSYEHKNIKIDLMKINIEGEEYKLLLDIFENSSQYDIKNIQIQWHKFYPNAEELRKKLSEQLSKTHYLTYKIDWLWENWTLKNQKYYSAIDNFNILANDYELKIDEIKNLKEKIDKLNKKVYNVEIKRNKLIAEIKTDKAKLNESYNNLKTELHNSKHECDKLKAMYNSSLAEISHLKELLKIYNKE